jgi:hypothetical protein
MHSFDTAQSLLALPADISQPSPYMVFGLAAGEDDAAAISRAIQTTIARLNAAKPNADPVAWKQAAVWVKCARGVLLDPAQKAQLDRIPRRPTTPAAAASSPVKQTPSAGAGDAARRPVASTSTAVQMGHDPLLGLLPGSGRGGPAAPAATPMKFRAGPARVLPPAPSTGANLAAMAAVSEPPAIDPFGIDTPLPPSLAAQMAAAPPRLSDNAPPEPTADAVPLPLQVVKPDVGKGRRRRHRFPWAAVSLGMLTLVSIGGITVLLYVLNRNPGGIVINLQAGAINGGEAAATDDPPPSVRPPRPPADPVMGRLLPEPERPPRRSRDNAAQLAAADNWLASLGNRDGDALSAPAGMPLSAEASPQPAQSMAAAPGETMPIMTSETVPAADPAMEIAPVPPGGGEASPAGTPPAGDAEAAQQAIEKARQAIAAADWPTMQPLAEAAQQAAVTAEQRKQASRLLQLAELASYYHGGVEKGLDGLQAAESFAVTDQLQVVVVEITQEKIVVKFSGRNKEYPRRELPLVLADKIAGFAMPAGAPETTAAGHAYQAVAPITTPQYRQQAIRALEAMTEEVEGAEPVDVAAAIRDVFGE